ncbi:hypothetical protein P3342_012451 [Pyrenophora teres f. teres]|nr:hypothetical protein PTNB85_10417 [Pyrenophora teres f. teres]KAE8823907.1 hypothetical protein HRS9139_09089 [Pyrenophora teres f. teres]KAE8854956.1 hypothetical protein PTNB29_09207 [Pyrenophora teres f. teres]KAK1911968.1 hypothetical protein P3342_012451 [Pyrenophora teres f. teres]
MEKDKRPIHEASPEEDMRNQEETHAERRSKENEQEDQLDDGEAQGGAKGRRRSSSELREIDESALDYRSSTTQTETGGIKAAREKKLGKKAPSKTGNSARTRKVRKKRITSTSRGDTAEEPTVTAAKNEKTHIIDAIKQDWQVNNISDVFPANPWLKGPMRKFADDTWDKETLLDLHNLTVYDQHEVAKQLSKRFNDRNHGGDKTVRLPYQQNNNPKQWFRCSSTQTDTNTKTPETAHAAPASAIPLTSRLLSTTPPAPSAPLKPTNTTQQSQQARLDYAANEWRQARQKLADAESTVDKILRQEIDEELGPMMKRVRELDEEVRRCGDSVARLRRRREE